MKKDAQSNAYVDSIGANRKVHPDFGADPGNGIPVNVIAPGTQPLPVTFDYSDESDAGSYPIPQNVEIEGGAQGSGDRHILLVDAQQCILYELFSAQQQDNGAWSAAAGIRMDLTSNVLRPAGKTSADAAGLPLLPGLVKYDEVASGQINHALRFTVPHTRNSFTWPARHFSSNNPSQNLPQMGARFRLRADFDLSGYSAANKVIMTALKRYGMLVADNGSAMYLSGVPDTRWSDDDLRNLGGMKASDFEAVDESVLELNSDSARVNASAINQ